MFICSEILGSTADIHTGGVDLKFPHHDNEIAQVEVKSIVYSNYSNYNFSLRLVTNLINGSVTFYTLVI